MQWYEERTNAPTHSAANTTRVPILQKRLGWTLSHLATQCGATQHDLAFWLKGMHIHLPGFIAAGKNAMQWYAKHYAYSGESAASVAKLQQRLCVVSHLAMQCSCSLSCWLGGTDAHLPAAIEAGEKAVQWYKENKDACTPSAENAASVAKLQTRLGLLVSHLATRCGTTHRADLNSWLSGRRRHLSRVIAAGEKAMQWYQNYCVYNAANAASVAALRKRLGDTVSMKNLAKHCGSGIWLSMSSFWVEKGVGSTGGESVFCVLNCVGLG